LNLLPAASAERYSTPLSLTSQFFFCGLPLRLDSYRGCAFQCSFCYARYRGGNSPDASVLPADPHTLDRVLHRAFREKQPLGVIGQFLQQRVPIHFGGMSDPFQPAEETFRVTQQFLKALLRFEYPTVISTRGVMAASEPYLELLSQMTSVVVQFSFVSTRQDVAERLQPHAPNPLDLLAAMESLARRGIPVTCRWQPYLRGISESPREFVETVARAGARHIAIEHLKLPVERNHRLWSVLTKGSGRDLAGDYRAVGARLDGRELVLPAAIKLPTILEVREATHQQKLSFGAADNELQYLSDTACCCSGVDQFAGFEGWFKHQIGHAVRRSRGRLITYDSIAQYWSPDGSVDRWLNSRSRIGEAGELDDHIKVRWNEAGSSFSPARYYGVEPSEEFTPSGFRVYQWTKDLSGISLEQSVHR
jgi:DNA repair photolyase